MKPSRPYLLSVTWPIHDASKITGLGAKDEYAHIEFPAPFVIYNFPLDLVNLMSDSLFRPLPHSNYSQFLQGQTLDAC